MYINIRYTPNIRGNDAHAGCTAFKSVHPALKSCAQGAGYTLNFKHRNSYNNQISQVLKNQVRLNVLCTGYVPWALGRAGGGGGGPFLGKYYFLH